jgi:hypothetical protein
VGNTILRGRWVKMKKAVFVVCLIAVAGWAGGGTRVDDSGGQEPGLSASTVAGPETLAVADSGYLFMYGNEIRRPFVFTIERGNILINGIPYRPRLHYEKPRIDTGWKPPAPSRERTDLIREAKTLAERLLAGGEAYTDMVDSVTVFFSSSRLVESSRNGAIAVTVKFRGVDGVYILGVPVKPPPRVRDWEEIWVETWDEVSTQYALILMEPYHALLDDVHALSLRLHDQGTGYEERKEAMGDWLSRSELVERVDVKPGAMGIDIHYEGIPGAYDLGVSRDPTEQPFYIANPEEAKRRAFEAYKGDALQLATSLSRGAFAIVDNGEIARLGRDRLMYLNAARRIGLGRGTQEDLSLFRETIAQRLMNPVPLEGRE